MLTCADLARVDRELARDVELLAVMIEQLEPLDVDASGCSSTRVVRPVNVPPAAGSRTRRS